MGREDPLEERMATHSSIFAGKIPWIEENGEVRPVELLSRTGLKRLSTPAHDTECSLYIGLLQQSDFSSGGTSLSPAPDT